MNKFTNTHHILVSIFFKNLVKYPLCTNAHNCFKMHLVKKNVVGQGELQYTTTNQNDF